MRINNASGHQSYDSDVHAEIVQYQRTGDEALLSRLIRYFEPLVKMSARKLSRKRPDLYDDLYQVGQMSLLRSLRKYDEQLGHPFQAYAMKSLVGHMKNFLRDKSWYIQVPRRIKENGARIQKVIDELTIKLNRSPDIREIAESLGFTEEETIEVLVGKDCYQVASLDVPLNQQEDSGTLVDLVASTRDDYLWIESRMDIEQAMNDLRTIERKVIRLIFHEGQSQRTVAQRLEISQMSVSRIQRKAIDKLRQKLYD